MSGPVVSVLGFAVLVVSALTLEVSARVTGRPATAARALSAAMRSAAGRTAVLAAWVWVGVHVLAR